MRFAFISKHKPTESQIALAADQGIELVYFNDLSDPLDGIVFPVAANRLMAFTFKDTNQGQEGAPPQYEASLIDLRGD